MDELSFYSGLLQDATDLVMERSRLEVKADEAAISTAATVNAINQTVSILASDLSVERDERKKSDDENMVYTKKMDKKNYRLAVFGAVTGGIALFIAILALLYQIGILPIPLTVSSPAGTNVEAPTNDAGQLKYNRKPHQDGYYRIAIQ